MLKNTKTDKLNQMSYKNYGNMFKINPLKTSDYLNKFFRTLKI